MPSPNPCELPNVLGRNTFREVAGVADSLSVPAPDEHVGQEKGCVVMLPQWRPQIMSLIFSLFLRRDLKARDQTA